MRESESENTKGMIIVIVKHLLGQIISTPGTKGTKHRFNEPERII